MRRWLPAVLATLSVLSLSACSLFGGGDGSGSQPVLTVAKGQCFNAPDSIHKELTSLERRPCDEPHALEAYAKVRYPKATDRDLAYPGSDALTKFAQSACAQEFKGYVGKDYLDSSLFFTYLLPTPQGWTAQLDRWVLCFIESSQGLRTTSAKGSRD
jgi:hypothetical protein